MRTFTAHCTGCRRPFAVFTVDNPNPVHGCPYCGSRGVRYELVTAYGPFPATENDVTHPDPPAATSARRTTGHARARIGLGMPSVL